MNPKFRSILSLSYSIGGVLVLVFAHFEDYRICSTIFICTGAILSAMNKGSSE